RWAENRYDRMPRLAAELVERGVAVLGAIGNAATFAAKAATTTIPVVFETGGGPVDLGMGASFARPGGNLTRVAPLGGSLAAKSFELLQEIVPNATLIGFLENPTNPNADAVRTQVRAAAAGFGKRLIEVKAVVEGDLDGVFTVLAQQRVAAVLIRSDVL